MVKYTRHTHCDVKVIETDWGVGLIEYTDNLDFQIPEKLDIEYDVCSKKSEDRARRNESIEKRSRNLFRIPMVVEEFLILFAIRLAA